MNKGLPGADVPGFYLAIYHDHGFGLLEAFETWMDPKSQDTVPSRKVTFEQFKVLARNSGFRLENNAETHYTTHNGNRVRLLVWNNGQRLGVENGAQVLEINYGAGDRNNRLRDAGNVNNKVLNGTILNSPSEAVVEISNPDLGTTLVLDMSDKWNPRRTSEDGEVEQAPPRRRRCTTGKRCRCASSRRRVRCPATRRDASSATRVRPCAPSAERPRDVVRSPPSRSREKHR